MPEMVNPAGLKGLGDDIGKVFSKIPAPTHIYENPDFVATHLAAAMDGVMPTPEQASKLKELGVDFGKAIDTSPSAGANVFDRWRTGVKQAWSGLWLKFEDATFGLRLDGALRMQGEAIENMTRAIQQYERVVLEGEGVIKQIQTSLGELSKMIDKAKAAGDNAAVERLSKLYEVRTSAIDAKTKQIGELKAAMSDLANEQKLLRMKHKEDLLEADRLKDQWKLNKKLEDLDGDLQGALDKFTGLQSDIDRINSKTITETSKAVNAAKQLNDSGGLIGAGIV